MCIRDSNYYNWFDEYEDYFMFYPDFDIFPFENLDVSPNIKAQRIKVLYSLIKKEQISILTTLSSLCRFTIPMKDFLIKKYKVNDDLDLFTDELYKFCLLYTSNQEFLRYTAKFLLNLRRWLMSRIQGGKDYAFNSCLLYTSRCV